MTVKAFFIISCLCLYTAISLSQDSIPVQSSNLDSINNYQLEKVKQEVEKLKAENSVKPIVRIFPTYAGVITAFVAVIGTILSFLKYLKEKKSENEQKKQEIKVLKEAKFDLIIEKLGSPTESIKASAAVSILTFLNDNYKEFHKQAYLILLGNLKTDLSRNINSLILKSFEIALRINFQNKKILKSDSNYNRFELDLSRMNLHKIDLQNIDGLAQIDFSFSNLQFANLTHCNLIRSNGYKSNLRGARLSRSNMLEGRFNKANFEEAQFHGSNLVSVKMKNAYLRKAEFQQAHLQDAHLDGAEIYGARFEYANLNNTYFNKIKYHEADLLSILKSKDRSWEKANFDKGTRQKLIQLSQK